MRKLILSAATSLVLLTSLWGQGSGTLTGVVSDPSGAVAPGVTVTATEVDTSQARTAITNSDGFYVITSLRPTSYTLSVQAPGFRRFSQTGITLQANESVTVNAKLEVGSASETITVEASPSQVDTTTSTIRQVVDFARVEGMPLNGRNAAQLVTLVAGSVVGPSNAADQGITKTFPVAVAASVNGTRTNQTSFLLDGVPNNELLSNVNLPFPMPDALQEFSVQASNYSSEFGQNAGGVVNIVTRSGSNGLHGDAFGYVRNAVFNARNFFATDRDPLKRSQYGGTIGGPVRKDKVFFFFGYQGTKIRSETGGLSAYVPTAANLVGDFSSLLSASNPANPLGRAVTLKDPNTGQPIANNQIPLASLDPASLNLSKTWLPRAGGAGLTFYSRPLGQNFEEYTAKVDYNLSTNDRLMVRYFRDSFEQPGTLVNSNILTYNDYSTIVATSIVGHETHIFSPRLLNEFGFGAVPESDRRGPPSNAPSMQSLGVQNFFPPSVPSVESINVSGFFNVGNFPPGNFPRGQYVWTDSLRYTAGRHSMIFGGSFEYAWLDEETETTRGGSFAFSGDTTGVALADFMSGKLRTFTQGNGTIESNRHKLFSLYGHDSFRVNARLTLNYGMRWEPSLPWHDKYQTSEIFVPALYAKGYRSQVYTNAPPGEVFPGDPGIPADGRNGQWNNFAPRAGFAWDPFGSGKLSVRGGAGVFYDSRVPGWNTNKISQTQPFSLGVTLTSPRGPFSNPYLGVTNPFPSPLPNPKNIAFPSPVTVASMDPGMQIKAPTTYNGNLTVEYQLANDWMVRAAYVGARSTHINVNQQANPSLYIPGSTASVDARRVYQGYSAIIYGGVPAGNAMYNSMQLSLQKRLSRGFTILANYTWSKTLDNLPIAVDASNFTVAGWFVLPITMQNYGQLDHGPSDFDRAHVVSVSYVWQFPNFKGANRALRTVAGGWVMSGIVSAQSGGQLTVVAGQDRSQTAVGSDRGVVVAGQDNYASGACANVAPCRVYLNPQGFAVPAIGSFGNMGKGAVRGPGLLNWDMGVGKTFAIRENIKFQLLGEYFNVYNHMNPTTAATLSLSGAGFGQVRTSRDPRIGQVAMKLTF